jgi:uncharacterized protein
MAVVPSRHPVLLFYVVTFAISWGSILLLVGPAGFLNTTSTSPTFAAAGFAAVLGPAIAGILVTALVSGRAGLRGLLAHLERWRVGLRWYAFALLLGPLLALAIGLALSLTSAGYLPAFVTEDDRAGRLLLGVGAGMAIACCEELGWTGFATPQLRGRHGLLTTGLIIGLLWGIWHLPLFAGSAASSGEVPPVLYVAVLLFAWLPPYRVLMVWLYDHTQSLLLVMLMHLAIVVNQYVFNSATASPAEGVIAILAFGAGLWITVGVVLLVDRAVTAGRERPPTPRAVAV